MFLESVISAALWVNIGGFSHHFQDKGRNEVHPGLGVELRVNEDFSLMTGFHKNSMSLRTRYAAVNYTPLHMGPVALGVSVGAMDGYSLKNGGGAFMAILPMASVEIGRVGVNVMVIPTIESKHVEGAVCLQIKMKF